MLPVQQLGTFGFPTTGTKSTYVKEVLVREFGTNIINFQSRHQKNLSEVANDASGGGSYIGAAALSSLGISDEQLTSYKLGQSPDHLRSQSSSRRNVSLRY